MECVNIYSVQWNIKCCIPQIRYIGIKPLHNSMAIRNLWSLFNLKESPFFQEALELGGSRRPVEQLFVGRQQVTTRIMDTIGGGGGSSRQAISGSPGVGKTSLAQYVKAEASRDRYLSTPKAVVLGHADDTDSIAISILGYVYEAIVANGDADTRRQDAVQDVRQLVKAFRTTALSGGLNSPIGGASFGRSQGHVTASTVRPRAMLATLLRDLAIVVRQHLHAAGVIVHVNNLENLAEADTAKAAQILRDVRDSALMIDGYHWLLVGTTEAIRDVVFGTDQVRTVVEGPRALSPLRVDEVLVVLGKRYEALRADAARPIIPPVTDEVVHDVFALFRGDLRGTMQALHTAAQELLSFSEEATSPLTLTDVRAVLHERYGAELSARLGNDADRLVILARHAPHGKAFVQKEARGWWNVSQGETSKTVSDLVRAGYVVEMAQQIASPQSPQPKQPGRRVTQYALSGAARLIFDPLP